jgi:hypothetical protein
LALFGYGIPGKLTFMKIFKNYFFLLFTAVTCFFTLNSFSQGFEPTVKKGAFNVGIEGGVQFTNINSYSSIYNPSSKVGFTSGLYGEYYVSSGFKLKVSFLYDRRPFQLSGDLIFSDTAGQKISNSFYLYQTDYRVNYLTIPFGIGYERGSDKFKLLLNFNLYYSLLLNATMNGGELYYFDPSDGFDLSQTILNQGLNEFQLSGTTSGVTFNDISNESTQVYQTEDFSNSDFGIILMLGGLYQASPQLGVSLTFGFGYSFNQVFENPEIDSKWSQMAKINMGVVYTLFKK